VVGTKVHSATKTLMLLLLLHGVLTVRKAIVWFTEHRQTNHRIKDLKYDNCNIPSSWNDQWRWWPELWFGGPPNEDQSRGAGLETSGKPAPANYEWSTSNTAKRYRQMRDALYKQNRTILYSLCDWGHAHVDKWGNETGQSWRMWGDINPYWDGQHNTYYWGITPILNHASFFWNVTNFWGHGDYDMLEVGVGPYTIEENRSHFAMWAAIKSPLIIGAVLSSLSTDLLNILKNPELIAFNQDPTYGGSAVPYKWGVNKDYTWNQSHPANYWVGPSEKGLHVFMLNTLNTQNTMKAVWKEIPGLNKLNGTKYMVHDMWSGKDLGLFTDSYSIKLNAHDTAAIRITLADGTHPRADWKAPPYQGP
jgi:alpha-galactosidase